mgnify:CR=1 FL=1
MKTYPVVEITFSPTGGTKKVADQISCYLGNITNTVNLIRQQSLLIHLLSSQLLYSKALFLISPLKG